MLRATVRGDNGWRRSLQLARPRRFEGDHAILRGRLKLARLVGVLGVLGLLVAWLAVVATATNTVPASSLGRTSQAITPDTLKPLDCAGITLTTIVIGSTGTAGNHLVLGSAGVDTMDRNGGNDCIIGGGGNDSLRGSAGTDVCLGGAWNGQLPRVLRDAGSMTDHPDGGGPSRIPCRNRLCRDELSRSVATARKGAP